MAGTSLLYSKVWFDYNDKAMYNLGDFRGGTAFSAWNDRGNVLFNTTGDNGENGASWRAFFNVVAQSNLVHLQYKYILGRWCFSPGEKNGNCRSKIYESIGLPVSCNELGSCSDY